jgi:hypothetical protein
MALFGTKFSQHDSIESLLSEKRLRGESIAKEVTVWQPDP